MGRYGTFRRLIVKPPSQPSLANTFANTFVNAFWEAA